MSMFSEPVLSRGFGSDDGGLGVIRVAAGQARSIIPTPTLRNSRGDQRRMNGVLPA
jgi:hypothetical protein